MARCKLLLRLLAAMMTAVICVTCMMPLSSFADKKKHKRIIVSLGDSYSSGEGLLPFYGYDADNMSKTVKNQDWLAHRSENSWPGMLTLPGVSGTMKDHKDDNWFFVASSGATTKNLYKTPQKKEYSHGELKDKEYIDLQLEVFKKCKCTIPDYVTMTLGGNDAGFVSIITEALLDNPTYVCPTLLYAQLEAIWLLYKVPGGIRDKLHHCYSEIARLTTDSKTGEKAAILVAGYPTLLKNEGCGVFSEPECTTINKNVHKFNNAIKSLVEDCQKQGMNIHFVDVEPRFKGREAYTGKGQLINPVTLGAGPQDLDDKSPMNGCSMHPNPEGAKEYAACVQEVINELESKKNADTSYEVEITDPPVETAVPIETAVSTPTSEPTPTPEPTATPTPKPTPRPDSKLAISKNNFPDKEFRRFLKNEVDKNKDGSLSKKEISKVKKMDFYDESGQPDGGGNGPYVYDIADLTGIERFANLESINIPFNNYLKHLDMTKNPKLKKVRFFDILPVKSAVIRIGQTIEYDSISAVGEYEQGNKNPYYKTKNKDIVSISTPKGSRACKFAGIKAGTAKITGDYQSNSWKIEVTDSSVRPVPTSTPKPKVKVSLAVKKTYTSWYSGKFHYLIPKITISGKDTSAANKKMKKDLKIYAPHPENRPDDMHYSYYIGEKFVSILVRIDHIPTAGCIEYKVYNVSIETGKLLSGREFAKLYGLSDKKFFKLVKEIYKNCWLTNSTDNYYYESDLEENLKRVSYKYITPFVNEDGTLCFIGDCYRRLGDGGMAFNTKTKDAFSY